MPAINIEVGTTILHVHEHVGHGSTDRPALVFLHYFGGSGRTWKPVMDALAAAGWRCLAPDLRGFGESPAPGEDWTHYTVDAMADDILGLIGRLRLERYIVVGHSMGGKVALALASRQPAGMAGLALVSPSPPTPEAMKDAERARLLAGYGDVDAVKKTLHKITARPLSDSLLETTIADNLRASAPAWRAWLEHGSREDISARMSQVKVPVRVVVGAKDQAITGDLVTREILARINETVARPQSMPDVGHLLPLEAPSDAVRFLLEAFANFVSQGENLKSA